MKAGVVVALSAALALAVPGLAGAGTDHDLSAAASRAKQPRPNCKRLLPQTKVESIVGGAVTLEHFGKADFIRNATTPGTEAGTECVYGTTAATENAYGIAGTVVTAFEEKPKDWNGYRASAKTYPGLEATSFSPVKLGKGTQAFVLHQSLATVGEPDLFYLYVYTAQHNMFSIDFFNGVTLKTEEGVAKELAAKLDKEWKQLR